MDGTGTLMDIREHGIYVDKKKGRVSCNYCRKEINSFNRLKCYLGGLGPDVLPCEEVTFNIRETFRKMVLEGSPGLTSPKRVREVQMGNRHKPGLTAAKRVGEVQMGNRRKRGRPLGSSRKIVSFQNGDIGVGAENRDLLAQKRIARFFYENCFDFSAVDSPSFKEMLRIVGGGGQKLPDIHDLKGRMLQETLKVVQDHVKEIKDSWEVTGCSILLDAWVDSKGRDLVSFISDCPVGPVYLKSFDVSDITKDVTALISLVDRLVEEVGVQNVIQIIACSTSGWVGKLGKSFAVSDRKAFWSVSVSHCFELMLVKIGEMYSFGDVLDKINNISEFINNNPSVLKLFRDHNHGLDLTGSSSEFDFLKPYLAAESIFNAKNNLAAMFASSDWKKEEGILGMIPHFGNLLVNDSSFWESVERVVKSTSTLIRGLLLFSTANNEHIGYIYDIMDGIKENIAMEFNHEELSYKLLWDVIDGVWNKHLHSPLHVTGYFLNPAAFYSTDFNSDPEVTTGLVSSLFHVVKDVQTGIKVSRQLEMYTLGKDCFNEASQADQYSEISPAE